MEPEIAPLESSAQSVGVAGEGLAAFSASGLSPFSMFMAADWVVKAVIVFYFCFYCVVDDYYR